MTAITAQIIAEHVGGRLLGAPDRLVRGVSAPDRAAPDDLVFATDAAALAAALEGKGGTLLVRSASALPADRTAIIVGDPRLAFARAARLVLPTPAPSAFVSPAAAVHPDAVLGADVQVDAGACVGAGAVLGDRVRVGPGAVVGEGVRVGEGTVLHPRVVLYAGVSVGDRCEVHAGTVVGAPGFGYVPAPDGNVPFPQLGSVVIGDDVEIGANCAIDRGALDDTVIGDGTKLDNLVHVGHGTRIGAHCLVAGQSGMAGRVRLGDHVQVAGQVGVDVGAEIGDGVQLGSRSWVLPGHSLQSGAWLGVPAAPLREARRRLAAVRRLPGLVKTVRELARG